MKLFTMIIVELQSWSRRPLATVTTIPIGHDANKLPEIIALCHAEFAHGDDAVRQLDIGVSVANRPCRRTTWFYRSAAPHARQAPHQHFSSENL